MILTTEGIKRSFPVGGGELQVLHGIDVSLPRAG